MALFVPPPSPFEHFDPELRGLRSKSRAGAGEKKPYRGLRYPAVRFSEEETRAIAEAPGDAREVAREWGTSEVYVRTLRRFYKKS